MAVLDWPYARGSYGRCAKLMSSKTTGERRWPRELTATMRAAGAAASAPCRPTASAKCPRWLVANCSSQPSAVRRRSGTPMTAALLTSMSSGPSQRATNAATDCGSARSSSDTRTSSLPVVSTMSAATFWPASVSRTASVTAAPALASALAVSMPMPEELPVTIARLPVRSTPATTSAALDSKPNGVVMRGATLNPAPAALLGAGSTAHHQPRHEISPPVPHVPSLNCRCSSRTRPTYPWNARPPSPPAPNWVGGRLELSATCHPAKMRIARPLLSSAWRERWSSGVGSTRSPPSTPRCA
jgi:hypothetical protein